jgi:hypothetical protein
VFDAVAGAFEGDRVSRCTIRSIIAEAMVASPNTCPQRENGRLEVKMINSMAFNSADLHQAKLTAPTRADF